MLLYKKRLGSADKNLTSPLQKLRVRLGTCKFNRFKPANNFVLLIVPSRYFCGGSFCFMSWCLKIFVLLAPFVCFHIFS